MQLGIIGLPLSGKTTIFNALTRGHAEVAGFASGKLQIHSATVQVPDKRVDVLSAMFKPRKTVYAQVQYNDIGGLARGIGEKGGLDGNLLNQIVQNDALVHVVRAFDDPNVPHLEGSVDPARDIALLDTELILSDLGVVERRLERIHTALSKGGGSPQEREALHREQALLEKFKLALENGTLLRDLDIPPAELKAVKGLALTTLRPVLVVLNTGEGHPNDALERVQYQHKHTQLVALQGKLEMELAQMSEEEAREFLAEYEIEEPSLPRVIRLSYQLLGMLSFFTVGEDEVRAWTLPVGATALDAAAAVHTDLARGFVRAEVVHYSDLVASGSLSEAKRHGVLRLEGKDYVIRDGDIVHIRSSV